ncbi:MAG: radical SAM protein [Candidatus Thermoplasmatota archaeon]|nr:radical SAM protein [Candidatus Thermoplasmatota archaeon]
MRKKYIPLSVAWELTLSCNMRCMHCGSSAGTTRDKELTTTEALNLCSQLADLHAKYINLTGGEAILRKGWYDISKAIKDLGMEVSVLSNGLALTDTMIQQLRNAGVYAIALSLDGGTPHTHDSIRGVPGSFHTCLDRLKQLREENLPVTVITTVHKRNFHELPLIRDLILGKTKAWQIQIAVPIGRFPTNLIVSKEEFYAVALFIAATRKRYSVRELAVMGAHSIGYHSQIIRNTMVSPVWKGCQAGISVLGIQSNGNIKGCLSLPDSFIEGNIRQKPLADIWNDQKAFSYTRDCTPSDLKNQCATCRYGRSCRGGCTTVSASLTGAPHCDPYCLRDIEMYMIAKEERLIS